MSAPDLMQTIWLSYMRQVTKLYIVLVPQKPKTLFK